MNKNRFSTVFIFLFFLFPCIVCAEPIARNIIAFWDSIVDESTDECLVHHILEMPLNHLGLKVIYYDIQKPLPDLSERHDIRGVLVGFHSSTKMKDPKAFIEWAVDAIDMGKKVVIVQNPGFSTSTAGADTSVELQNQLYEKLGIIITPKWVEYPSTYRFLLKDKQLIPFERDYPSALPGFILTKVYGGGAKSYLTLGIPDKPETSSDLIVISPNGAFASEFYATNYIEAAFVLNPRDVGWYIDPFRFFSMAFQFSEFPIPDPTTLAGRRIYFATCHGDSWNTDTAIKSPDQKRRSCAEIILEKVIKPNPDLPVAVGIVASDIDPKWEARKDSQEIAKRYLETPCVEAASHTYSHPFYWNFFRTGGPEKEIDYLYLYPYGTWQNSFLSWFRAKYYQAFNPQEYRKKRLKWGYLIPRAYANEPFNLNKEISGSVDYINQFAPPNNKAKLLIWSGDSRPWETPLALCYQAGIKNFGGGFTRFDANFPSNLFVYPFGRVEGGYIQLYSPANADNDYTEGWTGNFYGFKYLPATLKNTETPRRLKPICLYYHSYSGQFQESVDALLSNLAFVRTQAVIPLHAGRYIDAGEGFYSTQLTPLGPKKWKIAGRKGLQTIRFDEAEHLTVDFEQSLGVIGSTYHQRSLYVYLDANEKAAVLALKEGGQQEVFSLKDSSWEIWNVKRNGKRLSFTANGWGKLVMHWEVPTDGHFSISSSSVEEKKVVRSANRLLSVDWDLPYSVQTKITIEQVMK
jgi:hypothetical protein